MMRTGEKLVCAHRMKYSEGSNTLETLKFAGIEGLEDDPEPSAEISGPPHHHCL